MVIIMDLKGESVRKAQKEYCCWECGREIKTGSDYIESNGRHNDKWFNFKSCLACMCFRRYIYELFDMWEFGGLAERVVGYGLLDVGEGETWVQGLRRWGDGDVLEIKMPDKCPVLIPDEILEE